MLWPSQIQSALYKNILQQNHYRCLVHVLFCSCFLSPSAMFMLVAASRLTEASNLWSCSVETKSNYVWRIPPSSRSHDHTGDKSGASCSLGAFKAVPAESAEETAWVEKGRKIIFFPLFVHFWHVHLVLWTHSSACGGGVSVSFQWQGSKGSSVSPPWTSTHSSDHDMTSPTRWPPQVAWVWISLAVRTLDQNCRSDNSPVKDWVTSKRPPIVSCREIGRDLYCYYSWPIKNNK